MSVDKKRKRASVKEFIEVIEEINGSKFSTWEKIELWVRCKSYVIKTTLFGKEE